MLTQNKFDIPDTSLVALTVPQAIISDDEVEVCLQNLVSDERKSTAEILRLINLADQRKIYLHRGFGSLFDWLTKIFSYSESAAHRRIMAARLLNAVPEVSRKLVSGEVNLSTLAKTQSAIRFEEKISGTRMSSVAKADIIEKIESKSIRDTERVLIQRFPKLITKLEYERRTMVTETVTKLTLSLSGETLESLDRIKELVSHRYPDATFAQLIGLLAKDYLKRKDPLRSEKEKSTSLIKNDHQSKQLESSSAICPNKDNWRLPTRDTAADMQSISPLEVDPSVEEVSNSVSHTMPAELRRKVIQRDQGRCTFKDFRTGQICGSTFQVEIDHILPRALGGKNDVSNLRCLCRKHNQLMSEKNLGQSKANAWRNQASGGSTG